MERTPPCPRCGETFDISVSLNDHGPLRAKCFRCDFQSPEAETIDLAWEAWNRVAESTTAERTNTHTTPNTSTQEKIA